MLLERDARDADEDDLHDDEDDDQGGEPPVSRRAPVAEGDHAQDGEAFEDVARRIAVDHARDPVAVPGRALPGGQLLHALAAGGDGHEDRDGEHGLPVAMLPEQPQRRTPRPRKISGKFADCDTTSQMIFGPAHALAKSSSGRSKGKTTPLARATVSATKLDEAQDREDGPDHRCACRLGRRSPDRPSTGIGVAVTAPGPGRRAARVGCRCRRRARRRSPGPSHRW